MAQGATSKQHFSAFRSAAEEARLRVLWASPAEGNEPARNVSGVVLAPASATPYKVMLTAADGNCIDRFFATMREAEDFIRWNMPAPAAGSTLYERPTDSGLCPQPLRELAR